MNAVPEPTEQLGLGLLQRLGLRFVLLYGLSAGALFTVYAFPFEIFGAKQDWLTGYLAAYAHLAGATLRIFDSSVVVDGTLISGRYSLQIVRNCDAAEVNILFASALLAFPGPFVRRLVPLFAGLLSLVALNVLRICCLYYIGVYRPSWFRVAHEEIFPLLLVAGATALYLVAVRYLARSRHPVPA